MIVKTEYQKDFDGSAVITNNPNLIVAAVINPGLLKDLSIAVRDIVSGDVEFDVLLNNVTIAALTIIAGTRQTFLDAVDIEVAKFDILVLSLTQINGQTLKAPISFQWGVNEETPIGWSDIDDKPSTFPPTLPIDWADVTGKPDEYPPEAHNHDSRYYQKTEIDGIFTNYYSKEDVDSIAAGLETEIGVRLKNEDHIDYGGLVSKQLVASECPAIYFNDGGACKLIGIAFDDPDLIPGVTRFRIYNTGGGNLIIRPSEGTIFNIYIARDAVGYSFGEDQMLVSENLGECIEFINRFGDQWDAVTVLGNIYKTPADY